MPVNWKQKETYRTYNSLHLLKVNLIHQRPNLQNTSVSVSVLDQLFTGKMMELFRQVPKPLLSFPSGGTKQPYSWKFLNVLQGSRHLSNEMCCNPSRKFTKELKYDFNFKMVISAPISGVMIGYPRRWR